MKFLISTFVALLICLGSCSKKPSQPEEKGEPYYELIYSYVAPEFSILTFNSKTGEVLDSTWYPELPYGDLVFLHGGSQAIYAGRTAIWIADVGTGDTLAINGEHEGGRLLLSPDESRLVSISAQNFFVYSLPSLEMIFQKSATSAYAAFHPTQDRLYYIYADGGGVYDSDSLYILAYGTDPPTEQAVILSDSSDQQVPLGPMVVSGDGLWMLSFSYNWLFLTDLDSLKVKHIYKSLHFSDANYSSISLHPDGQRAFLTYSDPFYQPDIGGLDVFDFKTLSLDNLLDHLKIPETEKWFRPSKYQFTPDGSEIIGVNFQQGFGDYDLYRIVLATKELSIFAPNRGARGEYPQMFRLNPKPHYR